MISADSISITFDRQCLFSEITFTVAEGMHAAVTGESGSGKSTLLKMIIGVYVPETGSISVDGKTISPGNMAAIRKRVFYLPQEIVPYGDETVLEFLRYPFTFAVNRTTPFSLENLHRLLDRMRLRRELLSQPFSLLSGGERKRIGLLLGLLLDRPVLLLDEPTAGVDGTNRESIAELLFDTAGRTVMTVTHDESIIARSGQNIILPGAIGVRGE